MLSYSDFGEDRGFPDVDKVTQAVSILRATDPDLIVDGEMQADTAVNRARAESVFPFSQIAGDANVLVFPNLAAETLPTSSFGSSVELQRWGQSSLACLIP